MTMRLQTAAWRGWKRVLPVVLGALLATGWAADAAAQASSEYARAIDQAVTEFQAGRWQEARALFERAHALQPSARTLRGRGMVEFELRHYARAVRLLAAALADQRQALTPKLAAATTELLERARTFVGRYQVALEPPTAVLRVDGAAATFEVDGTLLLNVGEHALAASADGYVAAERRVDVRGGENEQLAIALGAEAAPAPAPVVAAPDAPKDRVGAPSQPQPAPQSAPPAEEPSMAPVTVAYVVAGVGVATFGIFGALALSKDAQLDKDCSPTCANSEVNLLHTLALVADIGLGVGVAAGIVGTVLLLNRGSDESAQAGVQVSPWVGRDAVGAHARGSF